nr:GNAT family N-acetyltransferase [Rhizomicrobium palustre]
MIGRQAWNACANPLGIADPHPFTRYEFFEALEESRSAVPRQGWQPLHLTLEHNGNIDGILPLYLKAHSQGEYVFDHAWADALERAGGRYYPKLQSAVPFTPVTGHRLLVAQTADTHATRAALLNGGAAAVAESGCSSLHITFPKEDEWRAAETHGYLLRTDRQFHWENKGYGTFDHFLAELSSSKRKNLRKERAAVRDAGITFDWLTGSDITEAHWDKFFGFYMDTGNRKWGKPYLTRDFFSRIGQSMAEQILLIFARRGPEVIAGALNLFGEGVLFGRHWGASEYVPFLHFETCYYQAIDFAIAQKLSKVEAGAQGEHKLLRGYAPVATYSAHFIAHEGLRRAVANYLEAEREAVADNITELSAAAPFKKTD